MATTEYIGNANRIVRIKDDAFFTVVNRIAEHHNMPLQWVFDAVCEALVVGYAFDTQAFEYYVINEVRNMDIE